MPDSFYDTNVLLYLVSQNPEKADRVEELVRQGGAISVQVLNEAANVARRKMKMGWGETHEFLGLLRGLLTVAPLTIETHELGLEYAERYRFSTYDAMIAAAAALAGCATLWSEDMQDGMRVGATLKVVNPFARS